MTEKEKMLLGHLYYAGDKELCDDRKMARNIISAYNNSDNSEEERTRLLMELVGRCGKNVWIEPTFRCDYGFNIKLGDNFYANYDCIMLDVCEIVIGDNVFFGPRVMLFTAGHPVDAEIRNMQLEYGKKIIIGNNVWIGGNTVINPGVNIGDNTVIGSGSVVTKDIPSGVVAAGNPCRVIRKITEEDKKCWVEKIQC
ncbi:maltose O-acetyltransferase [Clostridiales bacterium]|nr:maltose O-acetyltransferase [Clostridiales bacterium]